jgi:hypothetical protein
MTELTPTPLAPAPKPPEAASLVAPPPAPPVVDVPPSPKSDGGKLFKGRSPCDWHILPTETGIHATNSNSGEEFEGSMEEFNARLNG